MTFDGRTATTLFMLAIFAGAGILSLGLPQKAAFMPLLVCIPGAILCFWQLILDLRREPSPPKPAPQDSDPEVRSELEAFLWLGGFSTAILGFGFLVGGPLIVAAFIRYSSRESLRNAIFAGAGTFAVIWGVFVWLLELPLFQGLVLEALQ